MSTLNTFHPRAVAIALHRHAVDGRFSVPQHEGLIHDETKLNGFSLDQDVAQKIQVNTHFNGKETPLEVDQLIKFLENPENLSFFAEKVEEISKFGSPEHVLERLGSISHTLSMLHSLVEIKRHQELLALKEKNLLIEHHATRAKAIHEKHDIVAETIRGIHQKIQEAIFSHHQNATLTKNLGAMDPEERLLEDVPEIPYAPARRGQPLIQRALGNRRPQGVVFQ